MQRKRTMVIAVVSILGVAWFYYAPYLILKEMKAAAQAGKAEDLAEYVDFPAVRESLKDALKAKLEQTMAGLDPGARLALAFTGISVESIMAREVEKAMSPSGMAILMGGQVSSGDESDGDSVQMGYEEFGKFVVRVRRKNNGADLVLRRHGLSWKLTTVRFL